MKGIKPFWFQGGEPEPSVNVKICKFYHNILFSHKTKANPQVNIYVPFQTHSDLSLSLDKYILLFLVLSESVLQSAFMCFHVELNRELSCLVEQSLCEPQYTTFQYSRDFSVLAKSHEFLIPVCFICTSIFGLDN